MDHNLARLVRAGNGVVHRRDTTNTPVPAWALSHAVAAKELMRLCPQTYVLPGLDQDLPTLRRAAVSYAGAGSAISHTSALDLWGLRPQLTLLTLPVHVTIPRSTHRPRGNEVICVHRQNCDGALPGVRTRAGVPVVCASGLSSGRGRCWACWSVVRRVWSPSASG